MARWFAAAVLLAALPRPAAAQATAVVPTTGNSDIVVRLSSPVTVMPRFGFLPVRATVENNSPRPGTWHFRFRAGHPSSSTGAIGSRFEISARGGESAEAWFFVPMGDAAPRFTLGAPPEDALRPPVPVAVRASAASAAASASASVVESRAQQKLNPALLPPSAAGARVQWSTRIEPGDRPGENIGVATASFPISHSEPLPPGDALPLGFDVEDALNPVTGWYTRRLIYKETIPDPASGAPPRSSMWSAVGSSLTAEAAARRALEGTGLLQVPDGVTQSVSVSPLTSGEEGGVAAWLTTFVQRGSPRVLPIQSGMSLPAGTVTNLHASGRQGEIVRTISFVEPAALAGLETGIVDRTPVAVLAEARSRLLRYGFLRPQPGVTVSSTFPGKPDAAVPELHRGAVLWFESGPAQLLPRPMFGSLPPDTTVTMLPGAAPGGVVRRFSTLVRPQVMAPAAAGASAASRSDFGVVATGPGIAGAASVTFAGLQPASAALALPIGVSQPLAAKLRQTLQNGQVRGQSNLTGIDVASMPADWRSWSSFHAVLLRLEEYEAFDPARRAALRAWVMQGGLLFIEPVPPAPLTGVPLSQEPVGAGTITVIPYTLDDYLAPPEINESRTAYIKVAEPAVLVDLLRLHIPALTLPSDESLRQPKLAPVHLAGDSAGKGKWAAAILAVFAVLAGPVNLFVFAPAGRRHRLFLTMPALALAFAGAIVLSIIWWDGFGGSGDRAAVVLLLPEEKSAVVYQDQIAHTGILPMRRFAIDGRVAMANLPVDDYDATGRTAVLDRGEGFAGGDWFRNHWGSAQHLRAVLPTDARVQVRPVGGGMPTVDSNLPTTLTDFVYLDGAGRVWRADKVEPGQRVTLQRTTAVKGWPPLTPGGSKYLDGVLASVAELAPGTWVARGGATPVAPIPTLGSITWRDDVIYTGR